MQTHDFPICIDVCCMQREIIAGSIRIFLFTTGIRYCTSITAVAHNRIKFEKSPDYPSGRLFNHIPPTLQKLNLKHFKDAITTLLTERAYYSVSEFLQDSAIWYAWLLSSLLLAVRLRYWHLFCMLACLLVIVSEIGVFFLVVCILQFHVCHV